jgi:hypothetical protein
MFFQIFRNSLEKLFLVKLMVYNSFAHHLNWNTLSIT